MKLAAVLALTFGGGCSLLYNPDNIPAPKPDGSPDAKPPDLEVIPDVDPTKLRLDGVQPSTLVEGTGDGDGWATIVAISGANIASDTTFAITAYDGASDITPLVVDMANANISAEHDRITVPVKFLVDPTRDKSVMPVRLQITAMNAGTTAMLPDTASFELKFLDELTDASPEYAQHALASGVHEYSRVAITGGLTASDRNGPLIVRAHATIEIAGLVAVDAMGQTAGAGGFAGGAGGPLTVLGTSPGSMGLGPGGGLTAGGGGGFGSPGGGASGGAVAGSATLYTLDAPNRGSGGAGGDGSTLAVGGAGGGGGGTIELTAGGQVTIADVSAKGGDGSAGAVTTGGGGSGGAILVRGRSVTAGNVTAPGGAPNGGAGRIRIDSASTTNPATTPAAFRGPMLDHDTPQILHTDRPELTIRAEKNKPFNVFIANDAGTMTRTIRLTAGTQGVLLFQPELNQGLYPGRNTFCLIVDEGDASSPSEAQNCLDLVYVP